MIMTHTDSIVYRGSWTAGCEVASGSGRLEQAPSPGLACDFYLCQESESVSRSSCFLLGRDTDPAVHVIEHGPVGITSRCRSWRSSQNGGQQKQPRSHSALAQRGCAVKAEHVRGVHHRWRSEDGRNRIFPCSLLGRGQVLCQTNCCTLFGSAGQWFLYFLYPTRHRACNAHPTKIGSSREYKSPAVTQF